MWSSKGQSPTSEALSLGSLLDTLMCIVGVSLIILAAAQLELLKTKRDRDAEPIAAGLNRLLNGERKRAAEQTEQLTVLQQEWAERSASAQADEKALHRLNGNLPDLQIELIKLRALQQQLAQIHEVEARLNSELPTLVDAIQDLRGGIDRLQKAIANAPAATAISLPIRRVIKKNLAPVQFVCRHGRVYLYDLDQLANLFAPAARQAFASLTRNMSPAQRIRHVISHFNENNVGNRFFRVKLQAVVDNNEFEGFLISTVPRDKDQGETTENALTPESEFVKMVKQIDPDKQFIQFSVWSDSFDDYLKLRGKVESLHATADGTGTRVGLSWTPYAYDEEIREFWDALNKHKERKQVTNKSGTRIDN